MTLAPATSAPKLSRTVTSASPIGRIVTSTAATSPWLSIRPLERPRWPPPTSRASSRKSRPAITPPNVNGLASVAPITWPSWTSSVLTLANGPGAAPGGLSTVPVTPPDSSSTRSTVTRSPSTPTAPAPAAWRRPSGSLVRSANVPSGMPRYSK